MPAFHAHDEDFHDRSHRRGLISDAPAWVHAALRPDEVLCFDPTVGSWFGVRDGDMSEWRNIRMLTPAAVVEAPSSFFSELTTEHHYAVAVAMGAFR